MSNTFLPNRDTKIDVFYPGWKELLTEKALRIHNRQGGEVFEKIILQSFDPSKEWRGAYNSKKSPQDLYIYSFVIIGKKQELVSYAGNFDMSNKLCKHKKKTLEW